MTLPRYRKKGPVYYERTYLGTTWYYFSPYKRWQSPSDSYWPSLSTTDVKECKECWDELHPGPPYRSGGPLFIREWNNKNALNMQHRGTYICTNGTYKYIGGFVHDHPDYCPTGYSLMESGQAEEYGAKAWNKYRPARSSADLAQFLGELRDFKGMMKQTAKLLASTAFQLPKSWYSRWSWLRNKDAFDTATAGHYLNYQFGWKPFVNDILKFYKSMAKVESTIRFIRKNNNKWLKRGGTVHRDRSVTEGTISCRVKPVLNTYFHLAPGCTLPYPDTKTVTIKSERVWFKARMKYYIPGLKVDSCESIWSSPLLRRIYGLELTPALLWELTPWSWLVDWFADVGDVIANMSSLNHDNLVAKYAYVMRSERETTYLFTPWKIGTTQGVLNLDMTSSYYLDSKERHAASPYGFGVGWDDFSPYQLSILMALGLTR